MAIAGGRIEEGEASLAPTAIAGRQRRLRSKKTDETPDSWGRSTVSKAINPGRRRLAPAWLPSGGGPRRSVLRWIRFGDGPDPVRRRDFGDLDVVAADFELRRLVSEQDETHRLGIVGEHRESASIPPGGTAVVGRRVANDVEAGRAARRVHPQHEAGVRHPVSGEAPDAAVPGRQR